MERDSIRIVAWNCQGGFRDKWRRAMELGPDVLVVSVVASRDDRMVTIFAVWAMASPGRSDYPERLHRAVSSYADLLREPVVMIGDFNSNTIFDADHQRGSHSQLVARLPASGVASVYHERTGEAQGGESRPTFFMNRNPAKPYHLDYCFVSESLRGAVSGFSIGSPDDWLDVSDHLPLTVTLALPRQPATSRVVG